ncbi:MAG: DnaJ domain-containing protein [Pseudomonadota bacterium]
MTGILPLLGLLAAFLVIAYLFVNSSASGIANAIRTLGPLLLCGIGLLLLFTGRGALGLPALAMGGLMLAKNRSVMRASNAGAGQKSTVRSAWLEMQLDHETGDLDGLVLIGPHEGQPLSQLDGETLVRLYADLSGDNESAALMEAYLDRRIPGWRERSDTDTNAGSGAAFNSGAMTKQEAYQVLGLDPGAGPKEIRTAHRRLMKAVHPDSGGSTFLAARINEAKDTLLD